MTEKCPDCPVCGHPPMLRVGDSQAFCGNDDCQALCWETSLTQAENLAGQSSVDLPPL